MFENLWSQIRDQDKETRKLVKEWKPFVDRAWKAQYK